MRAVRRRVLDLGREDRRDDALRAARGIIHGVFFGLLLWALILAAVLL